MAKTVGFIGLGRMGSALCTHLTGKGFSVHGFDQDSEVRTRLHEEGIAATHEDLKTTIQALGNGPRTIWIMVPSRYVDDVLRELVPLLAAGDTVIDGGNSFFKESIRRYEALLAQGIGFIDCGTSGGVSGALHGASLMIGGDTDVIERNIDLFSALAVQNGYARVGGPGAGHFTKMVHNAIEYGMMGAIAEGVNILHEHKDGLGIDIVEALKPFENGSIIESSLVSWLSQAFRTEGYLEHIAGKVPKGETEMEMEYLIQNENVKVLDAAVLQRKLTRTEPSFIGTLIAAMRNQFGGHQLFKK
jgi:6-phosphogluconate dehydrogenase